MAIMIPEKPRSFAPASLEDVMFEALKNLPEDYYVIHSFRITDIRDNVIHENETDFVIFNREKGVLCLEAKAGAVRYSNGCWYYASGKEMKHDGPFNQASSNKYKLMDFIKNSRYADILKKCKFLHGVWFPSISDTQLTMMTLPPEADKVLILTKEALEDPLKYIEKIFSIEFNSKVETNLSSFEETIMIKDILCPQFNVFPSLSYENDLKKIVFHRLLKEQAAILNFLTEQRTAVINGAAGTGKTMIALEKARRHAAAGEKVLFLCYNNKLKNYLAENYSDNLISFYTISGLACKFCGTSYPDFSVFKSKLEDMYLSESFPYKHVIIDEGQDFGIDSIDEADILEQIKEIIVDNEKLNGTFYVFYDKLQLIQASHMPKFIEDADCKVTLYKNCRNTENIATTSMRPITDRPPKLLEGCVKGTPAKLYFCKNAESEVACLDRVINELKSEGYKNIVILTCKTEDNSILTGKLKNGFYRNNYLFTTCRKFKGLEADAIILTDVTRETFSPDNVLLYYVGTSRARLELHIISNLSDEDCEFVLKENFVNSSKIRKPKKDFSVALNAIGKIEQ